MDPLTIAIMSAVGAVVYATIAVIKLVIYTAKEVSKIFVRLVDRAGITRGDIGFITKSIKLGKHTHVQGIFNKHKGEIRQQVVVEADKIESSLEKEIDKKEVVFIT